MGSESQEGACPLKIGGRALDVGGAGRARAQDKKELSIRSTKKAGVTAEQWGKGRTGH